MVFSIFFQFLQEIKKNLHVNVSISCLSDFMECCFSVICLVYSKGLSILNLTLHLNQQQYSFCFILGGTQLKTLDVKTVEVKVEPTSSKAGESLNTSAASTSSNDGKGGRGVQSIEIHVSPEICACLFGFRFRCVYLFFR